jgi:hypothetical protein
LQVLEVAFATVLVVNDLSSLGLVCAIKGAASGVGTTRRSGVNPEGNDQHKSNGTYQSIHGDFSSRRVIKQISKFS